MKITAYKIGYSDKKDSDRVRYRIKNPLYLYFEMPCGTSRRVGMYLNNPADLNNYDVIGGSAFPEVR